MPYQKSFYDIEKQQFFSIFLDLESGERNRKARHAERLEKIAQLWDL
tara:strand:- start:113 stop:253 length:141 start_codon:yes stop_codon:yes gene_type:complete